MTAQAVEGAGERHDDHQLTGAVVQEVDRDHHGGPLKSGFAPDRMPEIYVVDLASPDQVSVSHSCRSATYCCHSRVPAQTLVVLAQPAQELLSLKGVDGRVQHVNDRCSSRLGEGLQALGVWSGA